MSRHLVAPLYVLDALAVTILLNLLHPRVLLAAQAAFVLWCLYSLWHVRFIGVLSVGFCFIRPIPKFYPLLHFVSLTVTAVVFMGERKGSSELFVTHSFAFLFHVFINAFNTLLTGSGSLMALPSYTPDPLLDQYQPITRFVVPFAVVWLGVFKLCEGSEKKTKKPWIWHNIASIKISMPQRASTFDYQIRFVQNHLVGIELDRAPDNLRVKVDAVEWTQLWLQDSLLIIYGLSPQVDYLVNLIDGLDECPIMVSTHVSETHAGVRRQTPMQTLLEARDIAVVTLGEEKQKSKKLRKEQNKTLAHLRNEIDSLSAKNSRNAKSDERLARKLLSLHESLKQLQEDIKETTLVTAELQKDRPESEAAYARREREYTAEMKRLDDEGARLDQALQAAITSRSAAKHEFTKLESRKFKQSQKLLKLSEDVARTRASTEAAIKQVLMRREKQRRQKYRRRATQQAEFEASIRKLELGVQEVQARARQFEEARSAW